MINLNKRETKKQTLSDLVESANLLECDLKASLAQTPMLWALYDKETGKQCTNAYTMEAWHSKNMAAEIFNYLR